MEPNKFIEENYEYYTKHHEELVKKYKNKFLIIKDKEVFGTYETLEEAIKYAKDFEAGTYIIQQCTQKDDTQVFHTRVRFNAG